MPCVDLHSKCLLFQRTWNVVKMFGGWIQSTMIQSGTPFAQKVISIAIQCSKIRGGVVNTTWSLSRQCSIREHGRCVNSMVFHCQWR